MNKKPVSVEITQDDHGVIKVDAHIEEKDRFNPDGSLKKEFITNRLGDQVERQLIRMLGEETYDELFNHIVSYQRKTLIAKRKHTGKPLTKWNQKRIENIEATLQIYGAQCFFCPTDMTQESLRLYIPLDLHYNYDNKNDKCVKLRTAGYPREINGRPIVLCCTKCSLDERYRGFLNWVLWSRYETPEGGWQTYTRRHYYQNEKRYPNQHNNADGTKKDPNSQVRGPVRGV